LSLGERLGIDLARTTFIGDRVSDVRAARAVGARPMLVRTGIDPINPDELAPCGPVEIFDALPAAVAALV
jgi:D-glycero-D-manno-heptose 1,7-bisphosphate phosphatase